MNRLKSSYFYSTGVKSWKEWWSVNRAATLDSIRLRPLFVYLLSPSSTGRNKHQWWTITGVFVYFCSLNKHMQIAVFCTHAWLSPHLWGFACTQPHQFIGRGCDWHLNLCPERIRRAELLRTRPSAYVCSLYYHHQVHVYQDWDIT